jgi:hypothetical protein
MSNYDNAYLSLSIEQQPLVVGKRNGRLRIPLKNENMVIPYIQLLEKKPIATTYMPANNTNKNLGVEHSCL